MPLVNSGILLCLMGIPFSMVMLTEASTKTEKNGWFIAMLTLTVIVLAGSCLFSDTPHSENENKEGQLQQSEEEENDETNN